MQSIQTLYLLIETIHEYNAIQYDHETIRNNHPNKVLNSLR